MSEIRFITGCAAVHPDQRGGQHVAMQCSGVLAIDDDAQIGVLVNSERSQFANKQRATEMLAALRSQRLTAEEVEALRYAIVAVRNAAGSETSSGRARLLVALSVLDKLIAAAGGE